MGQEENDGAAAQFAGGDVQAAEMQADLGERHFGAAGFAKKFQDIAPDVAQQVAGIGLRHGGCEDLAVAIHRDGAGGQLLHRGAAAKKSS